MKKVAVVYSSKSGTTKICAEYIAAQIVGSQLINLNEVIPDISAYDAVLIGSGIRMAKMYKPVKKFLAKNSQLLNSKKRFCSSATFIRKRSIKHLKRISLKIS